MSWIAYTVLYLERCGVHYWGGSVGSLLWVIYSRHLTSLLLVSYCFNRRWTGWAVGSLCCSLWSHLNWSKLVVRFKILLHTAHCPLPTAHCTLHVFAVPAPLSSVSDFFLISEQQPLYWHLSNLFSVWKSKANDWISLFLNPLQLTNTVIYQYFNLEFIEF